MVGNTYGPRLSSLWPSLRRWGCDNLKFPKSCLMLSSMSRTGVQVCPAVRVLLPIPSRRMQLGFDRYSKPTVLANVFRCRRRRRIWEKNQSTPAKLTNLKGERFGESPGHQRINVECTGKCRLTMFDIFLPISGGIFCNKVGKMYHADLY